MEYLQLWKKWPYKISSPFLRPARGFFCQLQTNCYREKSWCGQHCLALYFKWIWWSQNLRTWKACAYYVVGLQDLNSSSEGTTIQSDIWDRTDSIITEVTVLGPHSVHTVSFYIHWIRSKRPQIRQREITSMVRISIPRVLPGKPIFLKYQNKNWTYSWEVPNTHQLQLERTDNSLVSCKRKSQLTRLLNVSF